jgi:FkbM family methyltransferase
MSEAMQVFRAPNGLEVFHYGAAETKYVYQEIFEEKVYFRNGITLQTGETVFDIGANIGLFTVFVKEHYPGTKVFAFEPSPVIARVLNANVAKYGESVSVYECGVAGKKGQATFTFYPNYSIMSGFCAQNDQDRATLRAGIRSHLLEQKMLEEAIQDRFLNRMVESALGQKQEYVCPLQTVSETIEQGQVDGISLLKIDAEGSELDILAGIWPEDWKKIRQIVMEIHDPEGTISARIQGLLESHGYKCVLEQEDRLSGSGIVNCYAKRD